jgi:hypothetical protein
MTFYYTPLPWWIPLIGIIGVVVILCITSVIIFYLKIREEQKEAK